MEISYFSESLQVFLFIHLHFILSLPSFFFFFLSTPFNHHSSSSSSCVSFYISSLPPCHFPLLLYYVIPTVFLFLYTNLLLTFSLNLLPSHHSLLCHILPALVLHLHLLDSTVTVPSFAPPSASSPPCCLLLPLIPPHLHPPVTSPVTVPDSPPLSLTCPPPPPPSFYYCKSSLHSLQVLLLIPSPPPPTIRPTCDIISPSYSPKTRPTLSPSTSCPPPPSSNSSATTQPHDSSYIPVFV